MLETPFWICFIAFRHVYPEASESAVAWVHVLFIACILRCMRRWLVCIIHCMRGSLHALIIACAMHCVRYQLLACGNTKSGLVWSSSLLKRPV